eukprot:jgi/Bigna1/67097/fgenesh1_pg.3_\
MRRFDKTTEDVASSKFAAMVFFAVVFCFALSLGTPRARHAKLKSAIIELPPFLNGFKPEKMKTGDARVTLVRNINSPDPWDYDPPAGVAPTPAPKRRPEEQWVPLFGTNISVPPGKNVHPRSIVSLYQYHDVSDSDFHGKFKGEFLTPPHLEKAQQAYEDPRNYLEAVNFTIANVIETGMVEIQGKNYSIWDGLDPKYAAHLKEKIGRMIAIERRMFAKRQEEVDRKMVSPKDSLRFNLRDPDVKEWLSLHMELAAEGDLINSGFDNSTKEFCRLQQMRRDYSLALIMDLPPEEVYALLRTYDQQKWGIVEQEEEEKERKNMAEAKRSDSSSSSGRNLTQLVISKLAELSLNQIKRLHDERIGTESTQQGCKWNHESLPLKEEKDDDDDKETVRMNDDRRGDNDDYTASLKERSDKLAKELFSADIKRRQSQMDEIPWWMKDTYEIRKSRFSAGWSTIHKVKFLVVTDNNSNLKEERNFS